MLMKNYEKKPFPWNCSKCRAQAVYGATVDYVGTEHHDGRVYTVKIDGLKTPKCANCGQVMLDAEALDVLTAALYREASLLTPEQIRAYRMKANLTQQELGAALGVEDFIVEQWETGGQVQARMTDNMLRLFFGLPNVREILMTHQISTLPETPAHAAP
jgi:DNA-binding transcriptional regulator YiaG